MQQPLITAAHRTLLTLLVQYQLPAAPAHKTVPIQQQMHAATVQPVFSTLPGQQTPQRQCSPSVLPILHSDVTRPEYLQQAMQQQPTTAVHRILLTLSEL